MSDEAIHKERQKVYGPFDQNMIGTSQQMAGLLTQMYANGQMTIADSGKVELPDWAAPLFLAVAVKGNRMASGKHDPDTLPDLRNYAGKADDLILASMAEIPAEPAYTPPDVELPEGWEWAGECRPVNNNKREWFWAEDYRRPMCVCIDDEPRHIVRRKRGAS